jgi:hypothetical protein
MFPALEAAYKELSANQSEVRHVILMSDGHTTFADFEDLVPRMARANITVSTVALGASSDRGLLGDIAKWGNGRTYYLTDASHVPQVFAEEAQRATGTTLLEEPFTPVVAKNVQAFKGIDFREAPPLLGYVATRSKPGSEMLLESAERDPILARWQFGLGRTAVFTSDVKDRWAVGWLGWRGYPKFWTQLVRDTMRARDDTGFDVRLAREGGAARIAIGAIERDGSFHNGVEARARVVAPDQSVLEIPVRQTGPGSYEAEFEASAKGDYLVRVIADNGGVSRTLAYSYPQEYRFYPPNLDLLRTVSTETGGKFQPRPEDIFESRGETRDVPVPAWPYLAGMAAVLFGADVFLRRVRVTSWRPRWPS